ncbi:MAG: alpha/beta hydrolase [Clostridiales bacterium]|nr:alpha/beta hydrolase [Clostridiales bacterium]
MKKSSKAAKAAALVLGSGAAFFAVGQAMYRITLDSRAAHGSSPLLKNADDLNETLNGCELAETAEKWYRNADITEWSAFSPRNETIHAEVIEADEPSDVWVICIHGFTASPESMALPTMKFNSWGYNVLLPHLCGHGKSECKYVSMGWHDRIDICEWVRMISERYPNSKIVLYGMSMGAATVMMTTGEELPENVVCAIEDCGYTSVSDEFRTQIRDMLHLPVFPFIPAANIVTKLRAGYTFDEASSVKQLKKSKTPTLFIHGDSDTFVPTWMVDSCYAALNAEKEKLVIKGAEHSCSDIVDPELYFDTVDKFIKKYLKKYDDLKTAEVTDEK